MKKLANKAPKQGFLRREEIRGLFALGLLAVVASIRIQNSQIVYTFNNNKYDVTIFFDVTLLMWSLYAFFMVVGLSEDILGQKTSQSFRSLSTYYLFFSFIIIGVLACWLFYSMYPSRAPWLLLFVLALGGYFAIKKASLGARGLIRERKSLSSELKVAIINNLRKLKKTSYQFLLSAATLCYLLVIFGSTEEIVVPSAIIGSIFLVCFLLVRDLLNESKSKPKSTTD